MHLIGKLFFFNPVPVLVSVPMNTLTTELRCCPNRIIDTSVSHVWDTVYSVQQQQEGSLNHINTHINISANFASAYLSTDFRQRAASLKPLTVMQYATCKTMVVIWSATTHRAVSLSERLNRICNLREHSFGNERIVFTTCSMRIKAHHTQKCLC